MSKGFEPDYAPSVEHFASMSHEELYAAVQDMDPALLAEAQQVWQEAVEGLAAARAACQAEISVAVAAGWQGLAARAAAESTAVFGEVAQHTEDVMSAVEKRLGQAVYAAEAMRAAVPPPHRPVTMETRPEAILDPDHAALLAARHQAAEHARRQAIRVLDNVYGSTFAAAGNAVPAFAFPHVSAAGADGDHHHHHDAAGGANATTGVTGFGPGAFGGMVGLATLAEPERQVRRPSVPKGKAEPRVEEEPAPTYLVDMNFGGRLIGPMPPASPAVLGVWDRDR